MKKMEYYKLGGIMTVNWILILSIIIVALIILIIYIGKKMCDIAIKSDIAKKYSKLIFTPEQKNAMDKTSDENIRWLEKNSKEVEIISKDGLKLKGYEVTNNNSNIWVIAVHGYLGRASDMVKHTQKFIEFGYNVLILDLRAHGKSEGKYIGMGWLDHYDLELWIEKIISDNKNSKIILYGISMGAATVMMATGGNLPSNVKVCIEDCGYTSAWEEFCMHIRRIFHMLPFPLLYVASMISKIHVGYGFKEASSVKQVKKSKTPTLFIHGACDKFVPFEMLEKIYKSARCPKEKLEIEDSAHAESSDVNPDKYWSGVKEFINKYI